MSLDIISTTLRSDAPTQYMRVAAMEALTAMRDELEAVIDRANQAAALFHATKFERDNALQQLADQSAKMAAVEQQAHFHEVTSRAVMEKLNSQIAALESQAGAMLQYVRQAQKILQTTDYTATEWCNAEIAIGHALSLPPQAGADLLKDGPCHLCGKPTQSCAGDSFQWPVMLPFPDGEGKDTHYHIGCVTDAIQRVQALEAEIGKLSRGLDNLYNDTEATRQSVIRFYGLHHSQLVQEIRERHALSQEQATTRNV